MIGLAKPGRVNNAFIAAAAGHPLLERALAELKPRDFHGYSKDAAGPTFLDRLLEGADGVTFVEPELLYPRTPAAEQQAYAVHHEARSWKDPAGLALDAVRAEQRLAIAQDELAKMEQRYRLASEEAEALRAAKAARRPRCGHGASSCGACPRSASATSSARCGRARSAARVPGRGPAAEGVLRGRGPACGPDRAPPRPARPAAARVHQLAPLPGLAVARILGVSCYFHDAAAVRVEDGALVLAAEEERFTRKKHDASFPERAIEFCLEPGPGRLRRVLREPEGEVQPRADDGGCDGPPARDAFVHSMRAWATERHGIKRRLAKIAGVPQDRVLTTDHHLSHAASAYFPSEFDSAAVITVDGVGEWATATIGRASSANGAHRLEIASQIDFPHSLGLFYSAFTDFLGFEVNEGEYKVMGMAPYGEPRFVDELSRVLKTYEDGSFWLDLDYFSFHYSARKAYTDKVAELLGTGPRKRDEAFEPGEERSQRYADIAKSVQEVTERAIVNLARAAHRQTGETNLCFAGGVALNAMANRRILDETGIEQLFVPPAPGDSGAAFGAALHLEHVVSA